MKIQKILKRLLLLHPKSVDLSLNRIKRLLNDLGNPDRIGKYSNGDEIWGFKKFTLRFDKDGKLKNWTKPFSP